MMLTVGLVMLFLVLAGLLAGWARRGRGGKRTARTLLGWWGAGVYLLLVLGWLWTFQGQCFGLWGPTECGWGRYAMEAMLLAALTMVAYGLLGLFVLLPGVLVWRADSGQSGRRVGRVLLGFWGGAYGLLVLWWLVVTEGRCSGWMGPSQCGWGWYAVEVLGYAAVTLAPPSLLGLLGAGAVLVGRRISWKG